MYFKEHEDNSNILFPGCSLFSITKLPTQFMTQHPIQIYVPSFSDDKRLMPLRNLEQLEGYFPLDEEGDKCWRAKPMAISGQLALFLKPEDYVVVGGDKYFLYTSEDPIVTLMSRYKRSSARKAFITDGDQSNHHIEYRISYIRNTIELIESQFIDSKKWKLLNDGDIDAYKNRLEALYEEKEELETPFK